MDYLLRVKIYLLNKKDADVFTSSVKSLWLMPWRWEQMKPNTAYDNYYMGLQIKLDVIKGKRNTKGHVQFFRSSIILPVPKIQANYIKIITGSQKRR